ncbi:MAG: hypothetical protein ACK51K_09670 [Gammaproteobacteria bacterium]
MTLTKVAASTFSGSMAATITPSGPLACASRNREPSGRSTEAPSSTISKPWARS